MRTTLALVLALAVSTRAAAQPATGTVNVGDAEIHYELAGRGPVLVLIHGWAQDLAIWDDQVEAFADQYRVLRYDRRGYGASSGHHDPTADPDDLRILLDSLGIASALVLGLSGGSVVALNFAVAFPDRIDALVLYGNGPPAGFLPRPERPFGDALPRIAREHGLDSLRQFVHSVLVTEPRTPELVERLDRQWARYRGRDLLDPRPPSGRVPPAHVDQLGTLCVNALVVRGEHERPLLQAVADTLVARIPGARGIVITGGGHGAHFSQPAQFNRVVGEFLAEAARAGRRRC